MLFLICNNARFPLKIGMNIVGRDQTCDVFVPDPHISRKHLSIYVVGDGTITIIDLGSTNGMVINGERVPSAILHPGESFTVGQTTFLVDD
ncbi:MAG: FHA domain-containing protein [Fibrobacterota bacterium]|nr:FHA domain-containing protein [Fibrobacterota bacterium]